MRAPILTALRLCTLPALAPGCEPLGPGVAPTPAPDSADVDQDALVVSPAVLDFSTLSVLHQGAAQQGFTITNAGTETIAVHGHDEVVSTGADDPPFQVAADPIFQLAAGESRTLLVSFAPDTEGAWSGELRVNYGVEVLELVGAATAPVLDISGGDVAATPVGCTSEFDVLLRNEGSEVLEVESAALRDSDDYWLDPDSVPLEVDPGDEATLSLIFDPLWTAAGDGERGGWLQVRSNDPAATEQSFAFGGLGYSGGKVTETFVYAPGIDLDLVFAVDTRGLMAAIVGAGQDEVGVLIDALEAGNVDYRATVLTGADVCPSTSEPWVGDADADAADLLAGGLDGAPGDGSSALLTHTIAALGETCLEGFLREGAQLHVVVIAGDADESGLEPGSLLAALRAAASTSDDVVVSALVGTGTGSCGVSYGEGYADVALLTEGGEVHDLCSLDWSDTFQSLSDVSVQAARGGLSHTLDLMPLEDTLEVHVDGLTWESWTYETSANAVVFNDADGPPGGSTVEVSYIAAVSCD